MKKNILLLGTISLLIVLLTTFTYASDLKLIINNVECEKDEIFIHYSVINYIPYERENVSVVFKIIREGIPIACEKEIITIPKNADGSDINEVIINVQCEDGPIRLESEIFHEEIDSDINIEIEKFLSGCP